MRNVLRSLFKRKTALIGAPAVRRMKTYSAQSGYVYQYYYEGRRPADTARSATAYVFTVSANRRDWAPVTVEVEEAALAAWSAAHARDITPTERYAVAKMALFQAFDERAAPADMRRADVRVRAADVEAIAANLGID